jgi:hypothetical protein
LEVEIQTTAIDEGCGMDFFIVLIFLYYWAFVEEKKYTVGPR